MSRTIFLSISIVLFLAHDACSQPGVSSVQLNVSGARSDQGKILCSLFREGMGYPDQPDLAYFKTSFVIAQGKGAVRIVNIPAGQYAIAILHDENGDNKMNTSLLGLPTEGYGFSNNVMGLFGPPGFSKASFQVASGENKQLLITLRY